MDEPTLSGRLGALAIQDVMGFLATMRLDGRLSVRDPAGEAILVYRGGRIDAVEVDGGAVDVAAVLARIPGLDPGLRRRLLARGDTPRSLAARIDGAELSEELAHRLLVEEALAVVFAIGEWRGAEFRFDHEAEPDRTAWPLELDVPELLLESARRSDEWGSLPEVYADPETRFEMVMEPDEGNETIGLGLEEWRILYLVTNRASLQEIHAASGLDRRKETSQILFALASAGMIRPLAPVDRPEDEAPVGFTGAIDLGAIEMPSREPGSSAAGTVAPELPDSTEKRPAIRADEDGRISRRPPIDEDAGTVLSRHSGVRRLTRHQIRVRRRALVRRLAGPSAGEVPATVAIDGDELTIGRKPANGLVLPNNHVSGRHARIRREGDAFVIEDRGSVNGFAVDGRGRKRAPLKGGEEIEIYPYTFRFELEFDVDEADGEEEPPEG